MRQIISLEDIQTGSDRTQLYRPPERDLMRRPLLGRILRAPRSRLLFQIPTLIVALLLIYDGFSGSPIPSQNLATVGVWVHYRGLVMIALLLFGNLFCMSCPFTIPRTIALRFSGRGRRWPRLLRNKWLAVAAFAGFLFAYEWLDLWASPLSTAWIIIGYFVGAFVLEAAFAESPFCKYVCPLGTFNFATSTLSPAHVTVRDRDICRTCPGKECVNGSPNALGCGTELFPPTMRSNLDCTLCLDCARACPYDNVALAIQSPGMELVDDPWPRRWDISFLVMLFTFAAFSNAFGMVPPFYDLQDRLAALLGDAPEWLTLGLIFGTLNLALPALLGLGAASLSRSAGSKSEPLRAAFSRFAPGFIPLAVALWAAHYGFHFVTGALAIIPVTQMFLIDHGISLLGASPNWSLGPIMPGDWILPTQTLIVMAGFFASLIVGNRIARRDFAPRSVAARVLSPWLVIWLGLAIAALLVFNLPMEMRGTVFLGG